MLEVLRRLIHELAHVADVDEAARRIVAGVHAATGADLCSMYILRADDARLVLMATEGLNPEAVGQASLAVGEGLVGLVAERVEVVNVPDAFAHPKFKYLPETREEAFHGFLGVPVVHRGKVLGVLVVQSRERRRFSEDDVAFLFTAAAQLASAMAQAQALGWVHKVRAASLHGLPGAPGLAMGTGVAVTPLVDLDAVQDRAPDEPEAEVERYQGALERCRAELADFERRMTPDLPASDVAILKAYQLMLASRGLTSAVLARIRQGHWAPAALRDAVQGYEEAFAAVEDPYLASRVQDVRDLGRRILRHLVQDERDERVATYPEATVLVGDEVLVTDLSDVPRERLRGFVSAKGALTSHVALVARSLGIPAVVGTEGLDAARLDGRELLVDGWLGRVVVSPGPKMRARFERRMVARHALDERLQELRDQPACTPDGTRVRLLADVGLMDHLAEVFQWGAEGIGLYRTELGFMVRDHFPVESEQVEVYREVLAGAGSRPVTMRTLDVGGDKALPYFPIEESNPYLGWRGLRVSLDRPDLFVTQLRALMRSQAEVEASGGRLRVVFPMVTTVDEVDRAVTIAVRAHAEVQDELGRSVRMPELGVMIEVPSAVFQAAAIARRVDFLAIGSNDLTQYLLAVDRNNPRIASLFEPLHPVVLQAIRQVVEGARAAGRPAGMCGALAGDVQAAVLAPALDLDYLSMAGPTIPAVKAVIRSVSRDESQEALGAALACEHGEEVRRLLAQVVRRHGLDDLSRSRGTI